MIRRALWAAGVPLRAILIAAIRAYRATLAGWLGGQCRFYPTCSHYAEDAIRSRGAVIGTALAVWRVLRCNPFGRGGFEPAPPARRRPAPSGATYEPVIRASTIVRDARP